MTASRMPKCHNCFEFFDSDTAPFGFCAKCEKARSEALKPLPKPQPIDAVEWEARRALDSQNETSPSVDAKEKPMP